MRSASLKLFPDVTYLIESLWNKSNLIFVFFCARHAAAAMRNSFFRISGHVFPEIHRKSGLTCQDFGKVDIDFQ